MYPLFLDLFPDFSLPLKNPVVVFALVLFIILLIPVILSKLRIPGIIGLILSGVLIGPHGLNLLERNSAIELFSTIGLLYIMFLAGLELDLAEFRKNRHKSIWFGILSFAIPLAFGLVLCYYLLDYNFPASLMIGSLLASHTLVAYPILSKLGITKNESVAISVGGTILADTGVLLLLAVIIRSSTGALDADFMIRLTISVILFISVVFLGFPPIARWFFKTMEGEKTSHFIFVLAMVFLAAFFAQLAGLEAILGAFMAGLALNKLIPNSSPLMNRIEFVGNSLFIPFFLISVGMLVDLSVLLKGTEALIVVGVLTAAALLSKWLAAWITQKLFGYSTIQRNIIFSLSAARAAATLAVVLVGYNLGILDENVLNGIVILILITCLVASFVAENAGKKMALAELTQPGEEEEYPEKILVPISNPETMERLLDLAILLQDPRSEQPITALAVVQDNEEAQARLVSNKKLLEKAVHHASAADTKLEVVTKIDLNVASGIGRAMREISANMLVLGWNEKKNFIGKIFGNTLDNVLQQTNDMVWVCRLTKPVNISRRIQLAVPPHAFLEGGFQVLVEKISLLAKELACPISCYCDAETRKHLQDGFKRAKSSANLSFIHFDNWEDFLVTTRDIRTDDLLVLVSARKTSLSHLRELDTVPSKIVKYLPGNNFIVIYPEQHLDIDWDEVGI